MADTLRAIDLFCGCGGLSLGFELYRGPVRYEVVMALDNDPQPLTCYNANHPRPQKTIPTARLCDLTWFSHPSEIMLYYLVHLALWQPDAALKETLESPGIGLRSFLSRLRQIDEAFDCRCRELADESGYRKATTDAIDSSIYTLAITKAFFARLNLAPMRGGLTSGTTLPWQEEYKVLQCPPPIGRPAQNEVVFDLIERGLQAKWDAEVGILKESSEKEGKGQTMGVAKRLTSLVAFLEGEYGRRLRQAWLDWRSLRDNVRATFCTLIEGKLGELYTTDRRVHLLLGGPPCKGFSRVGRAKIASVREQGIHAWANKDYGDERNTLLHKYVLFLQALRPDVFVFENVRHFTAALKTPSRDLDPAAILADSIEDLSASQLHYEVESRIIRCREHAVPQDRERFFMVGANCDTTPERLVADDSECMTMRFGLICQLEKFCVVHAPPGSKLRTNFPNFGVMLPSGIFYSFERVHILARKGKKGFRTDDSSMPPNKTVMVAGMLGCTVVNGIPTKANLHPGHKVDQLPQAACSRAAPDVDLPTPSVVVHGC